MKIVFMGTPDFAVPSLDAAAAGHEVTAVVTQPDRPAGRGGKTVISPVKARALQLGIPCLQPERVKSAEAMEMLESFSADVFVVAAYGQILSQKILDMPRLGCVNVHASLLPKYRGAAPIQWSIINGETVTGITIMQMDAGIDTGDMLLAKPVAIEPSDDAGSLHDKLAELGAHALTEALTLMASGRAVREPQDDSIATYAPMLTKETGRIDWNENPERVAGLVRGLSPRPCAWTQLDGEMFKIYSATVCSGESGTAGTPGEILAADSVNGIKVAGGGGGLLIHELQRQNGKRLQAGEFLRGNSLRLGAIFGCK
ncbi:MAG: methionyl-tRNA formyltransferase [Defluviitaleaceae bacterium]|nr:methionyl-tRNA formyltransferase [Defluviitaleaceae bacterium]